jgi:hypothetical protein
MRFNLMNVLELADFDNQEQNGDMKEFPALQVYTS